jgi:hypothetical protein
MKDQLQQKLDSSEEVIKFIVQEIQAVSLAVETFQTPAMLIEQLSNQQSCGSQSELGSSERDEKSEEHFLLFNIFRIRKYHLFSKLNVITTNLLWQIYLMDLPKMANDERT